MCEKQRTNTSSVVLVSFLLLSICPYLVFAGPGSNTLIPFQQPDGRVFSAKIMGDEFLNWAETADGFTVIKNPDTQYWHYAVKQSDGSLAPSGIVVDHDGEALPNSIERRVRPEPQMSLPEASPWVPSLVSGNRNVLVILVNFANRTLQTTPTSWNPTIFDTSSKSVAKFYKDNSFNVFGVVGAPHTQSGIVGIVQVTIALNHPNYGGSPTFASDQAVGNAALAQASSYINFNSYDTNGNGYSRPTNSASILYMRVTRHPDRARRQASGPMPGRLPVQD